MELDRTYHPLRLELVEDFLDPEDGFIVPPRGAGPVVELNPQALARLSAIS